MTSLIQRLQAAACEPERPRTKCGPGCGCIAIFDAIQELQRQDAALSKMAAQKGALSESVDSRWVPTSEFKPQDGEAVLCYWPSSSVAAASMQSLTYFASDSEVDGREAWMDIFNNVEDEPTHWMPLPEAPK